MAAHTTTQPNSCPAAALGGIRDPMSVPAAPKRRAAESSAQAEGGCRAVVGAGAWLSACPQRPCCRAESLPHMLPPPLPSQLPAPRLASISICQEHCPAAPAPGELPPAHRAVPCLPPGRSGSPAELQGPPSSPLRQEGADNRPEFMNLQGIHAALRSALHVGSIAWSQQTRAAPLCFRAQGSWLSAAQAHSVFGVSRSGNPLLRVPRQSSGILPAHPVVLAGHKSPITTQARVPTRPAGVESSLAWWGSRLPWFIISSGTGGSYSAASGPGHLLLTPAGPGPVPGRPWAQQLGGHGGICLYSYRDGDVVPVQFFGFNPGSF